MGENPIKELSRPDELPSPPEIVLPIYDTQTEQVTSRISVEELASIIIDSVLSGNLVEMKETEGGIAFEAKRTK